MKLKPKPNKIPLRPPKQNCTEIPHVNSEGIWPSSSDHHDWWLNSSLPLLEFQLVLIFSSIAFSQFLLKRFGVSKLSTQIVAGLIFGYTWRNSRLAQVELFNVTSEDVLGLLGYFSYALYTFLGAVKVDVTSIIKGKKAMIIGIPLLFVPQFSGFIVQLLFDDDLKKGPRIPIFLFTSFHASTSVPVIASLLTDLKIVNSALGRLSLSSTLVTDIFRVSLLMAALITDKYRKSHSEGAKKLGSLILICALAKFAFRPAMFWMIKQTPEGKPVKGFYTQGVIFFVILSMALCNALGQSAVLGPYIMGLAVPDGAPLGSTLVDRFECSITEVLLPILATICAFRANLSKFYATLQTPFMKVNFILLFVVATTKFITCLLSSLYCKIPIKESVSLSFILSCKGVVDVVMYASVHDYNMVPESVDGIYTFFLLYVAVSATIVPLVVRFLYDPSRKYVDFQNRNIIHLNPNSELRVIACLHRNEHVHYMPHLLDLSCPTVENPLAVYVLHLIELIGRTTPIFIAHRFQNRILNDQTYSEHVIRSFEQFERQNEGTVYVECFTTVTISKLLPEDICSLALDKITSLILLPFHRTWTKDGIVDKDDNVIRTMNHSVLERAPCSIGIFVDKGHLGHMGAAKATSGKPYKYSVCVVYLGGCDDREAISYAKRMANDSRVKLSVLVLRSSEEDETSAEKILDSAVLNDFKLNCLGDGNVTYMEEVSEDGPHTALRLREIVNHYDLFIVGRRHGLDESPQTTGLSEWSEFSELGILGDLIASMDINKTASVLAIQQQIIKRLHS